MKILKNTRTSSIDEAQDITLELALLEIENYPIDPDYDEGFLSFENEKDIIHFMRWDENRWMVMIPTEDPINTMIEAEVDTEKVLEIVKQFSRSEDLTQLIPDYDNLRIRGTFCPLINETCRAEECMFWYEVSCSLALIGESFARDYVISQIDYEDEETEPEKYEEFKSLTVDEIAEQILSFRAEELKDVNISEFELFRRYWHSKDIVDYSSPPEIRDKMKRVENLVQAQIREKEMEALPDLCEKCIAWSRSLGFKNVRLSDVDAFLQENKIYLSKVTKRVLYSKVNVILKAKK